MRNLWVGAALGVMMLAHAGASVAADNFTVADAITDTQVAALVVVKQDGEEVIRQNAMYDFGDVAEKLVEIERLRSGGGHFEQKIEQLRPFTETDRGFASGLHDYVPGPRPAHGVV